MAMQGQYHLKPLGLVVGCTTGHFPASPLPPQLQGELSCVVYLFGLSSSLHLKVIKITFITAS